MNWTTMVGNSDSPRVITKYGIPQHWATSDPEERELIKEAVQEVTNGRILQLK